MTKLEKLKEELHTNRFWLGTIVATFLAIAGWLATNYEKTTNFLLVSGIIIEIICLFLMISFSKINRKIIDEIGKIRSDE